MKRIGDFEIVDHGIHCVDFPRCEFLSSESFNHTANGIGNDPAEAICDCIAQMQMIDFNIEDMEKRILEQMNWEKFPTQPSIDPEEREKRDYHYRISILWNEAHKLPIRTGTYALLY